MAWWSETTAAYAGGYGGATVGIYCGLLGGISGTLAPRGIGKVWVLGAWLLMIAFGLVTLIAGVVALIDQQPYHVYYPLLLGGFLCGVLGSILLPVIWMRYREAEQRKLAARELMQS
ncbi:hypothetical protein [Mucisphaera sp.]|uniref:hypothetical protein n=1 Tax=Mucisphaera sp. TaxID=2913024 RepID=UPI003D0EF2F1